ncbi:unnamed protein product, partial [marine sediment metagenome]
MKYFIIITLFICTLSGLLFAFESVAVCDNALSTIVNPAG